MHINQTRNLPCPAPSPSVQTPPRPGPRYLPEPEPPSPRVPGVHRLEIHLTARARGPGTGAGGRGRGGRRPQTKKPVRLGWAWLGPGAGLDPPPPPGPQPGLGRAEGDPAGCAGRRGDGREARRGSSVGGGQVYIYFSPLPPSTAPPSFFSPPPFFPSFCYLDFFSCCVMSIIYAKSFAACCTARASRRGRRAGRTGEEGRGSGEARTSDWGGEPGGSDPCHPGGPRGPLPGQEWKAGGAGHAAPLRGAVSGRSILEGARVGAGARESGLGTLCHIPVSLGLGP